MTDTNRLDELEARYTLQQDQIEQLSQVVWEQQRSLDALVAEVRRLRERLQGLGGSSPLTGAEDEKPPHY